ncbi:hypothetical protein [Kribbella qitaiheensis]|uniref:hypothetical protein n=1 Tax=Kribbella qitaiheensis TaxID=1544730 RepID=UPI001FE5EF34|nr:hypothetical protein [Kribbella qitaiheensis]
MSGQPAQKGSDQEVTEQIPALPWRVPLDPAPWWAWMLFVVPFVAVPILNSWLWMGARDFLAVALFTIIGASVVRVAGGVVLYRVDLTETAVKARTSLLVRSLAWQDVDGIEIVDDSVVLTSGKDENEINGIEKGRPGYVAAVMEAVRTQADASPVRRSRPHPGLGALLVLVYLLLSVGAFLIRWHLL